MDQLFTSLFITIQNDPLSVALLGAVLILTILMVYLLLRIRSLTRGASGSSLEEVIVDNQKRVADLEEHCLSEARKVAHIDARVKTSTRAIAVERFDPFQQQGGQQSFATAFLNEEGTGVVVSGIHSRDGVRIYAKEVEAFKSERELSTEEQSAIQKAQKNLTP